MPRKKNGFPYEIHPSPAKGEDGKNIVYAKPAKGLKMNISELDKFCHNNYALRSGELELVFNTFIDAAAEIMAMGYRIDTPIGSFVPKLALKREITDANAVKNSDVKLDGVDYNPGKRWNKAIGKWLFDGFRRVDNPNTQELMQDKAHLEEALKKSIKGGYTTVREFAWNAHLTLYSARKQLNAWTGGKNPKLMKTRMGQQDIYTEKDL